MQTSRYDGRYELVNMTEEADGTVVAEAVPFTFRVQHDEYAPHQHWWGRFAVPDHVHDTKEFIFRSW